VRQRRLYGGRFYWLEWALTQLSMSTDPNNPVVDWTGLWGIVEDFHDRSGVLRLRYRDGRGVDSSNQGNFTISWGGGPLGFGVGRWWKVRVALYLVVEEVFWKVEG